MSKRLVREVMPSCQLYIDNKTGIAWIHDGTTGSDHSVHPNIDNTGSVRGMKKIGYWGKKDKIVSSHGYKYNISKCACDSELDKIAAEHCQCESCVEKRKKEGNKYEKERGSYIIN